MTHNQVLMLIAVLVGAAVIAFIVFRLLRFMRGSIKLSLPKTAFNPGDMITGSLELHTKKEIEGNKLVVLLIGVEESTTREKGKTKTRTRETYRDEVILEDARVYPPGHVETYDFEMPTPNIKTPEFLNSTAGRVLMGTLKLLGNRSTRLKWKIEARLDAKGIDLVASKAVSINIRTLA